MKWMTRFGACKLVLSTHTLMGTCSFSKEA